MSLNQFHFKGIISKGLLFLVPCVDAALSSNSGYIALS